MAVHDVLALSRRDVCSRRERLGVPRMLSVGGSASDEASGGEGSETRERSEIRERSETRDGDDTVVSERHSARIARGRKRRECGPSAKAQTALCGRPWRRCAAKRRFGRVQHSDLARDVHRSWDARHLIGLSGQRPQRRVSYSANGTRARDVLQGSAAEVAAAAQGLAAGGGGRSRRSRARAQLDTGIAAA